MFLLIEGGVDMLVRLITVFVMVLFLAGCTCTNGKRITSLEDKVSDLEGKISLFEERKNSLQTYEQIETLPSNESTLSSVSESEVTVDSMTKEDIQTALKNAGLYNGAVDGKIGPETRKAIKEFQEANGLEPDGVAGAKTKSALIKYLAM